MGTHENTKLCDFTSTNNSDFICTPIAPPAPAANFYEIKPALLDWLLSLTKNSIDSWAKCKDAFVGRYYPPAKIIALRSNIMKFSQFDNEHVAQAWERMKSKIQNCPTHGLTTWMIVQIFYAGLNFLQGTYWI
jgi:hypothetical protein